MIKYSNNHMALIKPIVLWKALLSIKRLSEYIKWDSLLQSYLIRKLIF